MRFGVSLFAAFLSAAALVGCGSSEPEDAAADHDHGGGIVITHFSEATELFVEFPPLVVGEESAFAAHLTRLSDFSPLATGRLSVRLQGGGADEVFEAGPSATAGIFRPVAIPRAAGARRLVFALTTSEFTSVHDVGEVRVYPDRAAADADRAPEVEDPGLITFLKEQQWKVAFATEAAEARALSETVAATGVIRGRADGEAHVVAPSAGFVAADKAFPRIGQTVKAGETIARLIPRLGGSEDIASLRADREKAKAALDVASAEEARVEGLLELGAVPKKRLDEARAARIAAAASFAAAHARLAAQGGAGADSGIALRAPISGEIAAVGAQAGQAVEAGAALFHIVDPARLWLEAAVSEIDAARIARPDGAWLAWRGATEPFVIDKRNGALVAAGGAIDPIKRTLPVIFEFADPDRALKVGMFVSAHVATGRRVTALSAPVSSVIDDGGQPVVYVLRDGEHFERRIVRLGIRDAGYVEIVGGLAPGERVVSVGAHLVRLAASGPAEAGHGHVH